MHRLIGSRNGSNNAQTYCERARDTGRKEERRGSTQRIEPEKRGGEKRESKSIEQKESEREREQQKAVINIYFLCSLLPAPGCCRAPMRGYRLRKLLISMRSC